MYGSKAVAENTPYKLGLQIRPFGRTRGTWSNPRRFRPHTPATDLSRLARPPGGRGTPWSGQVPPARQLAPRWAPPSRPHAACPGRRTGPGARLRAPWLRAPPAVEGRMSLRVVQFASNPAPPTSACFAALALPIHRRAEARGGRPGWLGGWLGGQPEGAQKYIMTPRPPTHHPVDYLPIFRVSMAAPAWHIARSAGSPALESVTHPLEHHLPGTGPHPSPPESQGSPQPRELGCRGRASPKRQAPRRPKASAKNARPRPCQAGDQQRASHQGILPRQLAPQVFGSPAAQDLTHRAPHVQAAARQAPP